MAEHLSGLLIHVTSTLPWLLRTVKVSTSSELYPWLLSVAYFLFRHPVFLFTSLFLTQSVRQPLVTYPSLCSVYVTYRTPYHANSHQALSTKPLPKEADNFYRGGNHSKYVPLLTYLTWLRSIYYDLGFVFIHVKPRIYLLVVKTLIKKHRAATTLISNYESRNWKNCSLKKCISEHGWLKIPADDY